MVNTVE